MKVITDSRIKRENTDNSLIETTAAKGSAATVSKWSRPDPVCQRSCPPLYFSFNFRVGGMGQ